MRHGRLSKGRQKIPGLDRKGDEKENMKNMDFGKRDVGGWRMWPHYVRFMGERVERF